MGVSKVEFGNDTLIDLTGDTVNANNLLAGATAHGADGEPINGNVIVHDVIDNLSSDSAEDALSANQGRILNENLMHKSYDLDMLGYIIPSDFPLQNSVSGNQYTQNVSRVDLSTLNWVIDSSRAIFYSSNPQINGNNVSVDGYTTTNATVANMPNMSIKHSDILYIKNTSCSSVAELKQALSGKYMYYGLATPVTKQIDGNEIVDNIVRRARRDITSNLANLSQAVAEQNLEKYGYTIGDYFVGASGYSYHLADMNTYYGGYTSNSVVSTNHIGIVVNTNTNTEWLSSGSVTSYSQSTLHTLLTETVLENIKKDLTALFGGWSNHLLYNQILDNAIGGWGNTWVTNTYIRALSEIEIYGATIFGADGFQTGTNCKKLEIFNKFRFNEIFGNKTIWLKSLASSSTACRAHSNGYAHYDNVSRSYDAVGLILFY